MGSAGAPAPARSPRSTTALLQWLLVLGAGAVVVLAVGTADAADDEPSEETLRRGRDLYTQNCGRCHGPQGTGGELGDRPVPPIDDASVSLVRLVMAVGRMPPPAGAFDSRPREVTLTPDERAAILAYVTEEFDLTGDVAPPPQGDPARGQDLYATNCAACHGSTGGGGVAGQGAFTPQVTGYDPQTIADAVRTGPFAMPQFGPGQLSDDEVGHIAAFLDTVHEEEFAPLWGSELGPVFASAFAAALMGVVLILVLVIAGRPMWFPGERGRDGHGETDQDEQDQG